MSVGIGMDGFRFHAEHLKHLFRGEPVRDGGNVRGQTETLLHMAFAVIVLTRNFTDGDLVALSGGVKP